MSPQGRSLGLSRPRRSALPSPATGSETLAAPECRFDARRQAGLPGAGRRRSHPSRPAIPRDLYPGLHPAAADTRRRRVAVARSRSGSGSFGGESQVAPPGPRMQNPGGTGVSVTRRSPKPQRQVRFLGPPLRGAPPLPRPDATRHVLDREANRPAAIMDRATICGSLTRPYRSLPVQAFQPGTSSDPSRVGRSEQHHHIEAARVPVTTACWERWPRPGDGSRPRPPIPMW